MSEQTVKILIRLLLRSSLIRIFTVCHSFYIYWRHNFIVKLNCFILRTTTVAGLGVPIFRVFTVFYYFHWFSLCFIHLFIFSFYSFIYYSQTSIIRIARDCRNSFELSVLRICESGSPRKHMTHFASFSSGLALACRSSGPEFDSRRRNNCHRKWDPIAQNLS